MVKEREEIGRNQGSAEENKGAGHLGAKMSGALVVGSFGRRKLGC